MKIHSAVNLLHQFTQTYASRDLKKIVHLFTKTGTLWGTGIDEIRLGHLEIEEQFERDWAQSDSGILMPISSIIYSQENPYWASGIFRASICMAGKEHILEPLRGTIFVERENGVWKIAHMHASFPDYRQKEGNSFPDMRRDLLLEESM